MIGLIVLSCLAMTSALLTGPVDLTHNFDNNMAHGKQIPFTMFNMVRMAEGAGDADWYAANSFQQAEHSGTHLDAPFHFDRDGWTIDQIPIERFFGKAVYLNLREEASENIDYMVDVDDFTRWQERNGPIPSGAFVLLDFGYSAKYYDTNSFYGTANISDQTTYHFPGLSKRGAEWLAATGKVFMVATDAFSMEVGNLMTNYSAHTVLAESSVMVVDQLALPEYPLDPAGFHVLAFPMKITNGTGAPCRIIAVPSPLDRQSQPN